MSKVYTLNWFYNDQESIGNMFELCNKMAKDQLGFYLNRIEFLTDFMNSKCRKEMEEGHTWLLSVDVGDLFERYIEVDLGGDCSKYKTDVDDTNDYAFLQFNWAGWMYVYLHWSLKLPSRVLVDVMPINKMLEYYYPAHEAAFSHFLDSSIWMFKDRGILPQNFKPRYGPEF